MLDTSVIEEKCQARPFNFASTYLLWIFLVFCIRVSAQDAWDRPALGTGLQNSWDRPDDWDRPFKILGTSPMLGTGPLLGQAFQNAWDRPALGTDPSIMDIPCVLYACFSSSLF
jgi:hypothetical protein